MSPRAKSRLPRYEIAQRPKPEQFDSCMRYWVWSHTEPGTKYLVQLDSYNGNGECQCGSFKFNLEKILKAGITPEHAVARDLVKLKEHQQIKNALRCRHIPEAFEQFGEDAARAISHAQTNHPNHPPGAA